MTKNSFEYDVSLVPLEIKNDNRENFREALCNIPCLLYKVEETEWGEYITINKPGGKRSFGRLSRNDFMVFIFYPKTKKLWLISHDEIKKDLKMKSSIDKENTELIIKGLYRVCSGEEPESVITDMKLADIKESGEIIGLHVETLLKVYKWIWGQEDCNYSNPSAKGRWLSMEEIVKEFNVQI